MSENKGWRSEPVAVHAGEAIDPACVEQLHQRVVEAAAGQGLQSRETAGEGLVDDERQHQGQGAEQKGPARALPIAEGNQGVDPDEAAEKWIKDNGFDKPVQK